jgi:RNA ligase (TIGR02306 family)
MSSFSVTAERLTVLEHPNADALELAVVGGYRAVVKKGQYLTGDIAVYIPEQAIVPAALLSELGLTGRLAGKTADRVCAVRLRGELSQGIVCSPGALSAEDLELAFSQRKDLSETLGITKWKPEVPEGFGGELVSAPEFLPWLDMENLKRFPDVFAPGEVIEATEKVHGSSGCCLWSEDTGFMVSSRGLSSKYLAIQENPDNVYWRAARTNNLEEVCRGVAQHYGAELVVLYGEVFGSGVQDLTYAQSQGKISFSCFDARIVVGPSPARWLERDELVSVLAGRCDVVPVLYSGPYDYEALLELTNGPETVSGTGAHTREGLVIRAVPERQSDVLGTRAIAKLVGSDYLTRSGGTEYE